MPNDKEKKFYVIDHADKSSDPRRANPNRLKIRKVSRRWSTAADDLYGDANFADESPRKKG